MKFQQAETNRTIAAEAAADETNRQHQIDVANQQAELEQQ